MLPTNLDLDVLRTFVTGVDLGSYGRAAARLSRSASAISLQLRKLEAQTGQQLLRKQGRGLALTDAGEVLLGYARRLLDLNDEALAAMRGPAMAGWIRLGLPQDFAESWLPRVLARFARLHAGVRVEARVDRNAVLLDGLAMGDLDLALVWDDRRDLRHELVAELPMVWIGPAAGYALEPGEPLPLVAFSPPCIFRQTGIAALEAAGIAWRLAFSSPGLSGLSAAVAAGLGVTIRTPFGLPATLAPLGAVTAGLPALPRIGLAIGGIEVQPNSAAASLAAILRDTLQSELLSVR